MTPSIQLTAVALADLPIAPSAAVANLGGLPQSTIAPAVDLGRSKALGFVLVALEQDPSPSPAWSPSVRVLVRTAAERGAPWRDILSIDLTGEGARSFTDVCKVERFVQVSVRPLRAGADVRNVRVRLEHAT